MPFLMTVLISAYFGRLLTAVFLISLLTIGTVEYYKTIIKKNVNIYSSLIFLVINAICLGHLLLEYSSSWFLGFCYLFILVSVADSFSQLWGKLFGRHKLCPYLSPGKTLEGFLGGIVTTVVVSILLGFLIPEYSIKELAISGLIISIASTGGDLIFSAIKRKLNIKDFSNLLPGHGGIFDRFDSLALAAPVYFWASFVLK